MKIVKSDALPSKLRGAHELEEGKVYIDVDDPGDYYMLIKHEDFTGLLELGHGFSYQRLDKGGWIEEAVFQEVKAELHVGE